MADAVDQGSLATDELDKTREERDAFVEDLRGLPESASNDNPLPLEAIDTMVNKAEGDHEALAENAYQEKTVRETDGVEFNGLTSVEEANRDRLRSDIEEAQADAPQAESSSAAGPDATDSARALADERGVDLTTLKGSGKDGRITKDDVEAASA